MVGPSHTKVEIVPWRHLSERAELFFALLVGVGRMYSIN